MHDPCFCKLLLFFFVFPNGSMCRQPEELQRPIHASIAQKSTRNETFGHIRLLLAGICVVAGPLFFF
jgi:hypothetical protein